LLHRSSNRPIPYRNEEHMRHDQLEQSNFIYRYPDLAERVHRRAGAGYAQRWIELTGQHHTGASSVLDLGCWIGIDAEHLAHRYTVVGVDIQPHLIDYARHHRSGPDFQVGDMTNVRLNRAFDVVLCVGNTLSYVHNPPELDAAFATFAAHAHRGSLLILHTLLAPIADSDPAMVRRLDVGTLRAAYTDRSEWQPLTQLLTTRRTWRYDDGRTEVDILRRRILVPPELELRARLAGWEVFGVEFDPPELAGSAAGAVGCVLARFRGRQWYGTRPCRRSSSGCPPSVDIRRRQSGRGCVVRDRRR
jgi:SAM-dependent methyltransferase